jgi:hypothetical protein
VQALGGAIGVVPEESTILLSWWFLLPCLLVSGLAAYLFLQGTRVGDYPWAHYPLTVALAPIFLVGVYAFAITLSSAVSEFLEAPQPASLSVDGPGDEREHATRVHARRYTVSRDHPSEDHARGRGGVLLPKHLTERIADCSFADGLVNGLTIRSAERLPGCLCECYR